MYLQTAKRLNQGWSLFVGLFDSLLKDIIELTMHHTIEEQYFFPKLGKKMPQFAPGADEGHIKSHEGIHTGARLVLALFLE